MTNSALSYSVLRGSHFVSRALPIVFLTNSAQSYSVLRGSHFVSQALPIVFLTYSALSILYYVGGIGSRDDG